MMIAPAPSMPADVCMYLMYVCSWCQCERAPDGISRSSTRCRLGAIDVEWPVRDGSGKITKSVKIVSSYFSPSAIGDGGWVSHSRTSAWMRMPGA